MPTAGYAHGHNWPSIVAAFIFVQIDGAAIYNIIWGGGGVFSAEL